MTWSTPGRPRQVAQPSLRRASAFGSDQCLDPTGWQGHQLGHRSTPIGDGHQLTCGGVSHDG